MFRVQTKKERIAQANSERTVKVPSASRSRASAGEASSRLKGSSNTARAARLSSFSAAHLPKNRGGIKRRSKTTPPQAPSRGGKQPSSPGASSRWAGQIGSPGASSRWAGQTSSPGASSRGARQMMTPDASSLGAGQMMTPTPSKRKSRGGRQNRSPGKKRRN